MTYDNYSAQEGASSLIKQKSYPKRRLVQGVGINDLAQPVKVNGKAVESYNLWNGILTRCYSAGFQKKCPTYVGCSVAKEWHLFSNFERWFAVNYVEGWALDKDILFPGNKVYSAETCVFVPQALNNLLMDRRAARGACPLGVHFNKINQKYMASVCTKTGRRHLGYFLTQIEAHRAYQLAKANIIEAAETYDPRVRASLNTIAAKLRDDYANHRITSRL